MRRHVSDVVAGQIDTNPKRADKTQHLTRSAIGLMTAPYPDEIRRIKKQREKEPPSHSSGRLLRKSKPDFRVQRELYCDEVRGVGVGRIVANPELDLIFDLCRDRGDTPRIMVGHSIVQRITNQAQFMAVRVKRARLDSGGR